MMAHEFGLLRRILKAESGLKLSEDKQDMLEGKLRPLLKAFALPSLSHLALALLKPGGDHLRSRVAQAVTVQESYFFRDKVPFQYFADAMLPALMARRQDTHRLRVWCAAAATGQEPYSLAMALADKAQELAGWNVEIVATDFVEDALAKARKGTYSQFEVQRGLPVTSLVKHFRQVGSAWEIAPELRNRVDFRIHNLLDDCSGLGLFDVIFCRNVLIYFDEATKRAVLARLAGQLASDGYLMLGAAETTTGLSDDFMGVPEGHHGIFRFTPEAAAMMAARERKAGEQSESEAAPRSGSHDVHTEVVATEPPPLRVAARL